MDYKRRPIIWILNNSFFFATSVPGRLEKTPDDHDYYDSHQSFPIFLEEVKSVYISEDNSVYIPFVRSDVLEGMHPVTVFVYTYFSMPRAQKGIRRTHFQGYNIPTVYTNTVNDYSLMAPQPDYRRTLYWNPNVSTDKNGNAKVDFYNNSSCRQIIISAESITKDGKAIVYQ
jgi:hypothetical protein